MQTKNSKPVNKTLDELDPKSGQKLHGGTEDCLWYVSLGYSWLCDYVRNQEKVRSVLYRGTVAKWLEHWTCTVKPLFRGHP